MPIEFSTRKLRKRDLGLGGLTYNAPYVPVYQHGYGRMDSTTPGQGLTTSKVASCLAVVLHCPTTGRTTLTHSPNFLYMNTFAPIVDWITGGEGRDLDLIKWYEGAEAEPCEVEAVVLRGWLYATPEAIFFGHTQWMNDFRGWFSLFSGTRALRVNILDAPRVLTTGAVLVDKITGRITYLEREARLSRDPSGNYLIVENSSLPQVYSPSQTAQDLFVGMLLGCKRECAPISLQYDVSQYCLPMPLPDEGRQLIRSKRLGEPMTSQRAIIKRFSNSADWTCPSDKHGLITLETFKMLAVVLGPPCERCGDLGNRRCMACKGAWYCGETHQKDD